MSILKTNTNKFFTKASSIPPTYPPVIFSYFSPMFPKVRRVIGFQLESETWEKSCRDEMGMPNAEVVIVSENEWEYPIQSVIQDELYKNQNAILNAIINNMVQRGADREQVARAVKNIHLIEVGGFSKKIVFIFTYEGKYPFSK